MHGSADFIESQIRPKVKPSGVPFNYLQSATATAVIAATAIVKTTAEEKDYDKDDNPRASTATIVTTATHDRTSLRFSKPYYEKQREVLQNLNNYSTAYRNILPCNIG